MRRAETVLRVIFWGAILTGVSMVAVAAGQEFREHSIESLSQYASGGEHDPGELVRLAGTVKDVHFEGGRLEITLLPLSPAGPDLFFVIEVVAVRWPWLKSAMPFEPRVGEALTACGISRYDRIGHRWQINPMVPCQKGAL